MTRKTQEYYNEYAREWRSRNKDKVKESNRKKYDEKLDYFLFVNTKRRCERDGIPFELEPSDIVIPKLCPVLGVPMLPRTRFAPSIDRIDPTLGYIKGNVQIMSFKANSMKNDASPDELKKFAEWVNATY